MNDVLPDLNNPDTRREALLAELARAGRLVASELASAFSVSADTVRRDLLALETEGRLRRVRGGALPVARPARPFPERSAAGTKDLSALARGAASLVGRGACLLLDGGTTLAACAHALPAELGLTIVTPSPAVAVAAQAGGHEVVTVGGRLGARSGSAFGADAERAIGRCAADLCLVGACAVDARWGLGADDHDDASLKHAMIEASTRAVAVAGAEKLGRRSRFRVIATDGLDALVTDAPPEALEPFAALSLEVVRV